MLSTASKVTSEHLRRLAYLYVRQSSLQQVHDHRESTARQYELKRRAQALGWVTDQIVVIDEDLGLSGASAAERSGFQRLVAEVGLGRVGLDFLAQLRDERPQVFRLFNRIRAPNGFQDGAMGEDTIVIAREQ